MLCYSCNWYNVHLLLTKLINILNISPYQCWPAKRASETTLRWQIRRPPSINTIKQYFLILSFISVHPSTAATSIYTCLLPWEEILKFVRGRPREIFSVQATSTSCNSDTCDPRYIDHWIKEKRHVIIRIWRCMYRAS